MHRWVVVVISCVVSGGVAAQGAAPCETLIEQSNAQLDAMRRHAESIQDSLQTLSDALLTGAELGGADLTGATISGVDLAGADVTSTTLRDLVGTPRNLDRAKNLNRAFR